VDVFRLDPRPEAEEILPRLDRHDHLLHRAIPRPLADPLIVHSTWRAPFFTAARALAVARPRSLWQWTETTACPMFGTRAKRSAIRPPNSSGTV